MWYWMFLLVCLSNFANAQDGVSAQFSWLPGTWKRVDKNDFEVWQNDGNNLTAVSYRVQDADTVYLERTILTQREDSYFYIPDVAGAQLPVEFKITMVASESFTAENPLHDFPKVIRYRRYYENGNSMLKATIEGDGKTINYTFIKVK